MKVKTLLIVAALGLSGTLSAQSKYIKEANTKFANENYCEAASKCALAYTKIARKSNSALKTKADMAWKTAESYRLTENAKEAHDWYEKAILLKYAETEPLVYLRNAEVLMITRDFKEAAKNFALYKNAVPGDIRGENGLKSADDQMKDVYQEERTRHEISKVSALNKNSFEMAPTLVDKKGTMLAFSSTRPGGIGTDTDPRVCEPYMDIYVSKIDQKGNFGQPELLEADDVNTEDNEGTISVDGRGKTMFFTRCPNVKKQNLGCEIWMSEAKGKGWGSPVKLSLKPNDSVSVGHPLISDDGKYLIFVSDFQGEGSQGGRDLWYTTYDKKSESWGAPVNFGPEINTPGDELFPSYTQNGDLFYASNGLPGMGGLDIFRAEKAGDNKWQNPKNLGAPINSEFNDYAILEMQDDMKMGLFTSERKDSEGGSFKPDLYKFVLPPNVFTLKVVVSDLSDRTKKIEGAKVVVIGNQNGEKWEGITAKDGSIYWDKKGNGDRFINENSDYTINISKEGYHLDKAGSKLTTKNLKYDQDFVLDLALLPKKPIRLPEVRYPLAKWSLLVDSTINSKDSLVFVYNLLTEYPNMVLELSSHTDARGSANLNQVLSENRAKACYEYLVKEKGIDPRRIVPVGKGENEPRTIYMVEGKYMESVPNGKTGQEIKLTEAYINQFKKKDPKTFELLHQFNRRTEGKVLSMEFDPATAPPANPKYLEFQKLPKK